MSPFAQTQVLLIAALLSTSGCWLDSTPPSVDAGATLPDVGQIGDATATDVPTLPDTQAPSDTATVQDLATATDIATQSAWFTCGQASDCVAVEVGCCDHCNGGKLVAANKASEPAVKAALGAKNCGGTACTAGGCANAILACNSGTCAITPPTPVCASLGEAACKATTACRADYGKPYALDCFGVGPAPVKPVFLGCSIADACPQALGCATSPEGEKFNTSQLCAPAGWKVVAPDCCQPGCQDAESSKFCVRGNSGSSGEGIAAGDPIQVMVFPKGCWSSSCTTTQQALCTIQPSGSDFGVQGAFCLTVATGIPCTADCSGGNFATCQGGTWTAGVHKVSLGGVSVDITVPSTLPFGGACAGSQF